MTSKSSDLREAIAQSRAGRARWRCPLPLRAQVVALAQEQREAGMSIQTVARELGLSESGLSRWLKAAEPLKATEPLLRPVRLSQTSSPNPESLVLVTPQGFRLEGLSLTSAADLLRRLAC